MLVYFVFGDFFVDVGINNFLFYVVLWVNFLLYGEMFFYKVMGCFINGRNIVDLFGEVDGILNFELWNIIIFIYCVGVLYEIVK